MNSPGSSSIRALGRGDSNPGGGASRSLLQAASSAASPNAAAARGRWHGAREASRP